MKCTVFKIILLISLLALLSGCVHDRDANIINNFTDDYDEAKKTPVNIPAGTSINSTAAIISPAQTSEPFRNEIISDMNYRYALGDQYTVVLNSDGTVTAVGYNFFEQCDVGDWSDIIQISAGRNHTVGLKSDGTVIVVGSNKDGECNVDNWTNINKVFAGNEYTVGLKYNGTVVAVGNNSDKQCEVGDWSGITNIYTTSSNLIGLRKEGTLLMTNTENSSLQAARMWQDIISISATNDHIIGLKSDGTVVFTKIVAAGECDTSSWSDIVQVSSKSTHIVGLKEDGTVVATGNNIYGQCEVSDWTDIISISTGSLFSVGLKSDGTVLVAGKLLFDDTVINTESWEDIICFISGNTHIVGLKKDGTFRATGNNTYGQCSVDETKTDFELLIRPEEPKEIDIDIPTLTEEMVIGNWELTSFYNADFEKNEMFDLGDWQCTPLYMLKANGDIMNNEGAEDYKNGTWEISNNKLVFSNGATLIYYEGKLFLSITEIEKISGYDYTQYYSFINSGNVYECYELLEAYN